MALKKGRGEKVVKSEFNRPNVDKDWGIFTFFFFAPTNSATQFFEKEILFRWPLVMKSSVFRGGDANKMQAAGFDSRVIFARFQTWGSPNDVTERWWPHDVVQSHSAGCQNGRSGFHWICKSFIVTSVFSCIYSIRTPKVRSGQFITTFPAE